MRHQACCPILNVSLQPMFATTAWDKTSLTLYHPSRWFILWCAWCWEASVFIFQGFDGSRFLLWGSCQFVTYIMLCGWKNACWYRKDRKIPLWGTLYNEWGWWVPGAVSSHHWPECFQRKLWNHTTSILSWDTRHRYIRGTQLPYPTPRMEMQAYARDTSRSSCRVHVILIMLWKCSIY